MSPDAVLSSDTDEAADRATVSVRNAIGRLAAAYPFHAGLLSRFILVANRHVPTAGVTARMEGVYLIVNPEFWSALAEDEQVGVLHHETNHVLFGHVFEARSKFPDQRARIIAEEVTVNEWVPEPLPGKPIVLASFKRLPKGEDTDARYTRLARRRRPPKNAKRRPPALVTTDDHGVWADAVAAGESARLAARIVVHGAARELGPGQWEKLPESVRRVVTSGFGDKPGTLIEDLLGTGKSTIDWRGALRRIVTADTKLAANYARPPRRSPELAGLVPGTARASGRTRVMAVVDTSGSVNAQMLADIAAELDAMSANCTITVVECDAKVHAVYPFPQGGQVKHMKGRGGTDLRPPFDSAFLREHRPDAIVYFTDGDGPAPRMGPSIPVYWCLTPGGLRPVIWGRVLKMLG